jgi:hypothetical protein
MELYDTIINKIVIFNNFILHNDYLRTILLLVTSVFMGYVLQPVPKWLNNLFNTSNILKFFILFITGSIVIYPLNKYNIYHVIVSSILVLVLFHSARQYDEYLK